MSEICHKAGPKTNKNKTNQIKSIQTQKRDQKHNDQFSQFAMPISIKTNQKPNRIKENKKIKTKTCKQTKEIAKCTYGTNMFKGLTYTGIF